MSGNDLLLWWQQDPGTKLAVLGLGSFGNPRRFGRTARRVGAAMPVLAVHAGRPAAGPAASASRMAAPPPPVATREALFGQAGIIATRDIGELTEAVALLASQPVPAGGRVAIVSNTAGAGLLAAEACAGAGLHAAALTGKVRERIRRLLPSGAEVTGPVDTTAMAGPDVFRCCLEQVAADDGVDALLVLTAPTALAELAPAVCAADVAKPLALAVLNQAEAVRLLPGRPGAPGPVPAYASPASAVRALAHAARYGAWRSRPSRPGGFPSCGDLRPAEARALISGFLTRRPCGPGSAGARTRRAELRSTCRPGIPQSGGGCRSSTSRRDRGRHRRGAGTGVRPAGGLRPRRSGDRHAR